MIAKQLKLVLGPDAETEFEDHEELAEAIQTLRNHLLFGEMGEAAQSDPEAEQYHLLALGALEQAQRFAMLVEYKLRQARVGGSR